MDVHDATFTNEECRHGTHARPVLAPAQVRATAPAEGALILLPFGLSCRSCDDGIGLVAGCAECGLFSTDSSACGGCRRVGASTPASADVLPSGRTASLAASGGASLASEVDALLTPLGTLRRSNHCMAAFMCVQRDVIEPVRFCFV